MIWISRLNQLFADIINHWAVSVSIHERLKYISENGVSTHHYVLSTFSQTEQINPEEVCGWSFKRTINSGYNLELTLHLLAVFPPSLQESSSSRLTFLSCLSLFLSCEFYIFSCRDFWCFSNNTGWIQILSVCSFILFLRLFRSL